MHQLEKELLNTVKGKQLLVDFDSVFTRPLYTSLKVQQLWAKYMVRELGMDVSIQYLHAIRQASMAFLSDSAGIAPTAISYSKLQDDVFARLHNNYLLSACRESFNRAFEAADIRAMSHSLRPREEVIAALKALKDQGQAIHLVAETYLSDTAVRKILQSLDLQSLFEHRFVSSSLGHSLHNGTLIGPICKTLGVNTSSLLWIHAGEGNNPGRNNPLETYTLKNPHRSKEMADGELLHSILRSCEKRCRKSRAPFSEYILFFYYFTEKLYKAAKKNRHGHLFFLSREGLFLKKLFDAYQKKLGLSKADTIKTHYLMMSRQAVMLTSFRELEAETFDFFRKKYGNMSAGKFLDSFLFAKELKERIITDANIDGEAVVKNFIESATMDTLRQSSVFCKAYEATRLEQKQYFRSYLDSFEVDFGEEGMTVVDVGWGGSMQESLIRYFDYQIPVTGYYIGIRYIYDIQTISKRFGLYFSVYPVATRMDAVKSANSQLFEQLLGAPHGSTLGYTSADNGFAIQYHQEDEKYVHETYVGEVQDYMMEIFQTLMDELDTVCYDEATLQRFIDRLALREGIFTSSKKLRFLEHISKGFYLNIGQTRTGITYDPKRIKASKVTLMKQFILKPEIPFRYLLKLQSYLYARKLHFLRYFIHLMYYYMLLNFYFRDELKPSKSGPY